jgi:hypothetical protein
LLLLRTIIKSEILPYLPVNKPACHSFMGVGWENVIYFSWHSRQHELHDNISSSCPLVPWGWCRSEHKQMLCIGWAWVTAEETCNLTKVLQEDVPNLFHAGCHYLHYPGQEKKNLSLTPKWLIFPRAFVMHISLKIK